MNIYTVTGDFYGSVCELFSEHGDVKILPEKSEDYRSLKIDLLVFTGGEDIEPERYGTLDKGIRFNSKRDAREFSVISQVQRKAMKVNKVLGICRGQQLINVAMGGQLVPDIFQRFGVEHDFYHPLEWMIQSPLSILKETNSMHHQGFYNGMIGSKSVAEILAVEPRTKIIEAITWANQYLGVQFHPEFFPDSPMRRDIASIIISWCKGDTLLSPQKSIDISKERMEKGKLELFSTNRGIASSWLNATGENQLTTEDENTARISPRWAIPNLTPLELENTDEDFEEESDEEVEDLWNENSDEETEEDNG